MNNSNESQQGKRRNTFSAAAEAARELLDRKRLEVTIVHEVVGPGDNGPLPTGESVFRRFRDGKLIEERRTEGNAKHKGEA